MTKEISKTRNEGITLIALIITIIVMLILVGVTVTVALNGGLFGTAEEAVKGTKYEQDREILQAGILGAINTETLEIENKDKLQSNLPERWQVDGTGPYTAISPNGNKFILTSDGQIKEPSTGDLALLEKYFLGENGAGRNMNGEVMDPNSMTFKPYDKMPEFPKENLEFLGMLAAGSKTEGSKHYNIIECYVKYGAIGYIVTTQDDLSSSNEEYLTKSVERVYEQTGREGNKYAYDINGDGINEECTILYDYGEGKGIEIVAPDVVGENLTLGFDDVTAQTPGDIDKDGTANTNLDKAIYSYNNAVKTINDYAKEQVKNTKIPKENIRSVGSNPRDPYAENTTLYELEDLKNWNAKYNKLGKSTDRNYKEDIMRMIYHNKLNINKEYWLASRMVLASELDAVRFFVRGVEADGSVCGYYLWSMYSNGSPDSNVPAYGVRPIIKLSNI